MDASAHERTFVREEKVPNFEGIICDAIRPSHTYTACMRDISWMMDALSERFGGWKWLCIYATKNPKIPVLEERKDL